MIMSNPATNNTLPDIVAVDDNPTNLKVLMQMLRENDYKVRLATNGQLALTAVQAKLPDLILLDIMMPDMDGYEVCRRLKANERTKDIPVIFISAIYETIDKITAFAVGGVDYITKPFQHEEVLARIKTHLALRQLQLSLQEKNQELEAKNYELAAALAQVKKLSGLLPICANCKKIRNDAGYWQNVETYIHEHSEADFSHGMCPDCMQELYPDLYDTLESRRNDIVQALTRLQQASLEDIAQAVNMPVSNTLSRLEIMVKEKQVEQIEVDKRIFYKLPGGEDQER
jgi:CheY-like chemotaxis protein